MDSNAEIEILIYSCRACLSKESSEALHSLTDDCVCTLFATCTSILVNYYNLNRWSCCCSYYNVINLMDYYRLWRTKACPCTYVPSASRSVKLGKPSKNPVRPLKRLLDRLCLWTVNVHQPNMKVRTSWRNRSYSTVRTPIQFKATLN